MNFNLILISILLSMVLNNISNNIIKDKVENKGYVYKSKRITKVNLIINLIINLIPGLNVLIALSNFLIIKNEKLLFQILKKNIHLPESVISEFNRTGIDIEKLNNEFVLDGANEEIIKEELEKIKKYEIYATLEKSFSGMKYLCDEPIFNKEDLDKANALKLAKQFLFEIECNVNLNNKEKEELLKIIKKEFLNNNELEKDLTINKILKLTNKSN